MATRSTRSPPASCSARQARRAGWLAQAGAFGGALRHPGRAELSVAYVGVTPLRATDPPDGARWFPAGTLPPLAPRHRAIVEAALRQLRERMDRAPIAFRLLGRTFTLSDLQAVYELLLGRRLHKASFRRALQAAFLVVPTDEWRSEGAAGRLNSSVTRRASVAADAAACGSTCSAAECHASRQNGDTELIDRAYVLVAMCT